MEAAALTQPMHRDHPPMADAQHEACRHPVITGMDGLKRPARPHPQRDHPIDHHVAETAAVSRTEVRLGARATRTRATRTLAEEPMN